MLVDLGESDKFRTYEAGAEPIPLPSTSVGQIASVKDKIKAVKTRSSYVPDLVDLQQQTLDVVSQLLAVEQERLQVEKERLAIDREVMEMKKIKLLASGVYKLDDGSWVCGRSKSGEE